MTSQYLGSQRKLIELPRKLLVLHTCLPRDDDIFGWLSLYHETMDQFIIMPILKEKKLSEHWLNPNSSLSKAENCQKC